MSISELINNTGKTAFSFELLPPLKGNSIQQVFNTIDRLKEFDPKYINITTHHSESIYKEDENGTYRKVNVRRRPGSVAIAAAIQNKYGIKAIPHIISQGFSKEETEYALIDLSFLGVTDLLLLRGDSKKLDTEQRKMDSHSHATGLQAQVNNFNKGITFDGSPFTAPEQPFSYGMACYPEKHEESPNMESEIYYTKIKVDNGAEYLVTQMFFDNSKFFDFVKRCREAGIKVPIIPGIKPIHLKNQLTVLPRIFRTDIPEELATALRKCKDDEEAKEVGVEWCIRQCKELICNQVPSIHFYSLMATESVYRVAGEIY
ncbi:methylenetetrahydrofolate reductase [Proteiniphilum sp. UBA5384]|uniref:methylenetetrahydrofolate reductase n=1 Tax=Proteiniphilum sp. UBA5384 TaxID=1947279 RepID=UPI0025E38E1B|nr:methylenetetrahydrofolate reductase [Proteiniphilum sp. UBA5384]